jgi:hypothetical protein
LGVESGPGHGLRGHCQKQGGNDEGAEEFHTTTNIRF